MARHVNTKNFGNICIEYINNILQKLIKQNFWTVFERYIN